MGSNRPSFLIIGAQKSGTTSLADALSAHRQVFISEPREPEYFSSVRDCKGGRSWESYLNLYSGAKPDSVCGEASTGTMLDPGVFAEIDSRVPQVKLIAMLRHPVTRAWSGLAHDIKKGRVTVADGPSCFEKDAAKFLSGEETAHDWFRRSEYGKQLKPFADHYGQRLKILIFEELIAEEDRIFCELLDFLELESYPLSLPTENQSRIPRNGFLEQIIRFGRKLSKPMLEKPLGEKGYRRFRECLMGKIGKRFEPIDPDLAEKLSTQGFGEDIELLEQVMGRRIDVWK